MTYKRLRLMRRIGLFLAAFPLIQATACTTGLSQILGNTINTLPAIIYNSAQSTALIPAQIGLALATGGFGGGGLGNNSNSGLGGTSGLGGSGGGI